MIGRKGHQESILEQRKSQSWLLLRCVVVYRSAELGSPDTLFGSLYCSLSLLLGLQIYAKEDIDDLIGGILDEY